MSPEKAILIYDGDCPVCVKAVNWVEARSLPDAFEFISCHSDDLARRFPLIDKAACLRAIHLILPGGTLLVGERAIPEILRRLPRYRFAAPLFGLPGALFLARAIYRWFAGNRHRLLGLTPRGPQGP